MQKILFFLFLTNVAKMLLLSKIFDAGKQNCAVPYSLVSNFCINEYEFFLQLGVKGRGRGAEGGGRREEHQHPILKIPGEGGGRGRGREGGGGTGIQ
jgi:hypothetical protein